MPEIDIKELSELQTPQTYVRQIDECPKCGWRIMRLPAFVIRWFDLPHTNFSICYCQGGMDPEKTLTTKTPFGNFENIVQIPCAGIRREHLHVICGHCRSITGL